MIEAGKLPPSARPKAKRAPQKPLTLRTKAWAISASAPRHHRDGQPGPGSDSIDQSAREQEAGRVGRLKPEDDVGEIPLRPPQRALQLRLQDAENLPVDVVDRGGGEQQAADQPAEVAARGRRVGRRERTCGVGSCASRWGGSCTAAPLRRIGAGSATAIPTVAAICRFLIGHGALLRVLDLFDGDRPAVLPADRGDVRIPGRLAGRLAADEHVDRQIAQHARAVVLHAVQRVAPR